MSYYRLIYKENPVAGDNAMVIQALTGENEHQIVVFPSDHPDLDANGELLDRWGTPYFFHALTRHQLDIWSAGPDQKFGSFDDLKLGEENESLQLTREEQ